MHCKGLQKVGYGILDTQRLACCCAHFHSARRCHVMLLLGTSSAGSCYRQVRKYQNLVIQLGERELRRILLSPGQKVPEPCDSTRGAQDGLRAGCYEAQKFQSLETNGGTSNDYYFSTLGFVPKFGNHA